MTKNFMRLLWKLNSNKEKNEDLTNKTSKLQENF